MFGRRRSPPQDLTVHIASTDSSPRASVTLDEAPKPPPAMGDITVEPTAPAAPAAPAAPVRPLSVAIPKTFGAIGPYCVRRPNLSEILANESQPPWTLSAFMAYLSQNHCLETLEFTMDASRYGKHYAKMAGRIPGGVLLPNSKEASYLKMLWTRLMEAYIEPNGPREVNLPAEVRNGLLSLVDTLGGPPPPNTLDNAVQHIYTLMEESVLLPFLNSYHSHAVASEYSASAENLHHTDSHQPLPLSQSYPHSAHPVPSRSYEEGHGLHRRSKRRSSPQGQVQAHGLPNAQAAAQAHTQAYSSLLSPTVSGNRESKPSTPLSGDADMTDDLMSTTSTMTSHSLSLESSGSVGLHTPPTTPPMADCQPFAADVSPTSAGINSPADPHSPREAAWKRGMMKLGLRKSNRNRTSGVGYGAMEE